MFKGKGTPLDNKEYLVTLFHTKGFTEYSDEQIERCFWIPQMCEQFKFLRDWNLLK